VLAIVFLSELLYVSLLSLFDIHEILNDCGTGRNPDYMDLNVNFTITVIKAAAILRMFPSFLKP